MQILALQILTLTKFTLSLESGLNALMYVCVTYGATGPSRIATSNYAFGRKIWSDGCLGIEPGVFEIILAEGRGLQLRQRASITWNKPSVPHL